MMTNTQRQMTSNSEQHGIEFAIYDLMYRYNWLDSMYRGERPQMVRSTDMNSPVWTIISCMTEVGLKEMQQSLKTKMECLVAECGLTDTGIDQWTESFFSDLDNIQVAELAMKWISKRHKIINQRVTEYVLDEICTATRIDRRHLKCSFNIATKTFYINHVRYDDYKYKYEVAIKYDEQNPQIKFPSEPLKISSEKSNAEVEMLKIATWMYESGIKTIFDSVSNYIKGDYDEVVDTEKLLWEFIALPTPDKRQTLEKIYNE